MNKWDFDIANALRQAIALAECEDRGAPSQLLVRHFGRANAMLLVRDYREDVSKLLTAHRALARAIKLWDESPQSAAHLARAAVLYDELMRDLSRLCRAPAIQKATAERHRERVAYHRDHAGNVQSTAEATIAASREYLSSKSVGVRNGRM